MKPDELALLADATQGVWQKQCVELVEFIGSQAAQEILGMSEGPHTRPPFPSATHLPSAMAWTEIEGLDDVKQQLVECIAWPIHHPDVFMANQLPLHCGVLLYGPPGCGKTLLAMALPARCNASAILIHGPELLDKYVGASERAVRDTFHRAREQSPCIIVFDDFEAIAGRRGADRAGVTDRVVNQLLTELDGANDRTGVYVVATSSRPEMLDPAILRPGRIDYRFKVALPDADARHAIINSIVKTRRASSDAVEWLARQSEGFSGADIRSVLGYAATGLTLEEMQAAMETFNQLRPAPTHHATAKGVPKGQLLTYA